jgi:hypothetical protein
MFFKFLRGQGQASPVYSIKKQSIVNYFHVEEECAAVATLLFSCKLHLNGTSDMVQNI